jgi:hypothetical protein
VLNLLVISVSYAFQLFVCIRTINKTKQHGRKSRGDGGQIPQNLQRGTLIQVVPPDFCRFSKFQALTMDSSPQISTQIYATVNTVSWFFCTIITESQSYSNDCCSNYTYNDLIKNFRHIPLVSCCVNQILAVLNP